MVYSLRYYCECRVVIDSCDLSEDLGLAHLSINQRPVNCQHHVYKRVIFRAQVRRYFKRQHPFFLFTLHWLSFYTFHCNIVEFQHHIVAMKHYDIWIFNVNFNVTDKNYMKHFPGGNELNLEHIVYFLVIFSLIERNYCASLSLSKAQHVFLSNLFYFLLLDHYFPHI